MRFLIALAAAGCAHAALTVTALSTRPDMVTGGDVLIEVKGAGGAVTMTLNGKDAIVALRPDAARGSMAGIVDGLRAGANQLIVKSGGRTATLNLVNHPRTGPVFAGEHLKPFVCNTIESGLGPPLDADCSAPTVIEYFYRSKEGGTFKPLKDPRGERPADVGETTTIEQKSVPYIVRVESGTINRAIYRIAMLYDPASNAFPAWNQRILYSFGGGCGANYTQGRNTAASALMHPALSRGFAHIISTQNVLQQHCNDALSAEALMMIKEHFIETYGVPQWTMGYGGSGGSIQQLLIAQNYPGLLDGLLPSASYPDSVSIKPDTTDCRLLIRAFGKDPQAWTEEKRRAVEGYTPGTCAAWDRSFGNGVLAANVKGCGIAPELVYDPVKNPKGARCTTWDTNASSFGRDPATGFVRSALDNAGVQYGLKALNSGAISKAEFIALNRNTGGYTADGLLQAARTQADPEAVRLAYATGRINTGAGGLATTPMIHFRGYTDPAGDIHDRIRDFVIRERLKRANGRFDNQVLWIMPAGNRELAAKVSGLAIDTMTAWLDAIAKDRTKLRQIDKVGRAKPAAAVDGCWAKDGARIDEPATLDGAGKCNELYPAHRTPRMMAGVPLTDDIMKCALKPLDRREYKIEFTDAEMAQLREIFPSGVCDYSKPGIGQGSIKGTFLKLPLK